VEFVTILWSLGAGVALTLAVVWLVGRRDLASLMLCILGVATAASAYAELGMLHSVTAAEYGEWLRWYHLTVFPALMAQLFFIHYYLGTGRSWLMWTIVLMRSAVLVVNFAVHPNFNFSSIVSLRSVSLLGEQVSQIAVAVPRLEWQWFATANLVLFLAYMIDAVVRRWLKGGADSRRKALAVSLAMVAPLACTIIYTQLLVFGVIKAPVSNMPWFLGALIMMAYETERDFVLSRRARLEMADLRVQLAQVERATVLGQLAPALAHELRQPLAAIAANTEAGLVHLTHEKPDLEELRSILADIGGDNMRAAEIITRMRRLFSQRAIQLKSLGVQDVVQDVVSLVGPEAKSKHVALNLHMQPGLPRVLGDRVHLSQVLLNLLTNSIHVLQSRPPDARHILVEARAGATMGEVEMAVRDSGPGIPETIADDIFEPFFSTRSDGMGMGLSLSRTIIEAHGGRLWADPITPQEGAIFRFTLRRA
jgi:signal transduction histidine kinase